MHTWTFNTEEVSMGHYKTKFIRSTGESIESDGTENDSAKAAHSAYQFDRKKGIIPCHAAYAVSRAMNDDWKWTFHEEMLGSWSGISLRKNGWRIDYDGKDMILIVRTQNNLNSKVSWNGRIQTLDEVEGMKYFVALLYAS
jgi:hypothetical protein